MSKPSGDNDMDVASVCLDVDKWAKKINELFEDKGRLTKTESLGIDAEIGEHFPLATTAYCMSLSKRQMIDDELNKMLDNDII